MAQDAIALLDADHQRVEALFRDFRSSRSDPAAKLDLAQVICLELNLHATLEEELFYPALEQATGERQLVEQARAEHQQVKDLIAQVAPGKDIDALMVQIEKYTLKHVEEERRELFAKARSSGMELKNLGRQIENRKAELATFQQEA